MLAVLLAAAALPLPAQLRRPLAPPPGGPHASSRRATLCAAAAAVLLPAAARAQSQLEAGGTLGATCLGFGCNP
ncbi:hypothetical protein AB1Y20_005033 [Prymnesium parvum]|uniref:Uncharacterized protein n=1 Tax=Prymnesium parvum TaxID=97485 RepID=A0AB34J517_PRYPA